MDSDVIFVVASLCDCLKFCHHKTSDVLRLAIYQIINGNWQNYEQGIMPQSQLIIDSTSSWPFVVNLYSTLRGVSLYDCLSNISLF
jgi:hypothetical protein